MNLEVRALRRAEIASRLDDLAQLRIRVFRDWPYLYAGDLEYERRYLAPYCDSDGAVVAGAFDGTDLIGAATGTPMLDHQAAFGAALDKLGIDLSRVFYCAESVLLPAYRGNGVGHAFFDVRENHALQIGMDHAAFCDVRRPADHPARTVAARSLHTFWRKRGYREVPGAIARFSWRDVGESRETEKPLQFWLKRLTPRRDAALQP